MFPLRQFSIYFSIILQILHACMNIINGLGRLLCINLNIGNSNRVTKCIALLNFIGKLKMDNLFILFGQSYILIYLFFTKNLMMCQNLDQKREVTSSVEGSLPSDKAML